MPFCPQCRSEYVDRIEECPECRGPLIAELRPPPPSASAAGAPWATVCSTYHRPTGILLQARLEGAGLACRLVGHLGLYTSFWPGPIHVQVAASQEAVARRILNDLGGIYLRISGRELAMVAPPRDLAVRETGRELALVEAQTTATGREIVTSEAGREEEAGSSDRPASKEAPQGQGRWGEDRPEAEGGSSSLEWATVYDTLELSRAWLVRSLLESSGLPVFVRNEQVARAQFPLVMGGLQVQVPSAWAPVARELLQAAQE